MLRVGEGKTAEMKEGALRSNRLPVKLSAPTAVLITAAELR